MIAGEEEVAVEVPVGPSITMHNDNDNDNNNDTPTKTDTANEVAAVDESHMSQDSKTISDMNTDTNAANGEVVVQNNVVETIAADEPPTQTPSPPPSHDNNNNEEASLQVVDSSTTDLTSILPLETTEESTPTTTTATATATTIEDNTMSTIMTLTVVNEKNTIDIDDNNNADGTTLLLKQKVNDESPHIQGGDETMKQKMVDVDVEERVQNKTEPPPSISNNDAMMIMELRSMLQEQMTLFAETERRSRHEAEVRTKEYNDMLAEKNSIQQELDWSKDQLSSLTHDKNSLEMELSKLRVARDEHERKEVLLSNRVNDAKKKEALKANLAEQLKLQVTSLQEQLDTTMKELKLVKEEKDTEELSHTTALANVTERLQNAEVALADERRLNEERKKKMKVFVESKQEELRQARAQADELNLELSQTNRSMREHQTRWKQLHAQWVQSQTRNRELLRELSKLQKDQETANRIGDKMEIQMAKSAQETTLHKTKRLTAKHELMTVLRTLDGERELSCKLRDSIKFTFTPKALSQQQLMKESLKDFERELLQLSRRLGRPLPPSPDNMFSFEEEGETLSDEALSTKRSRSEIDTDHLLSNLEDETQRVSQCIMALGSSVERMHMVLSENGERNCVGVLHDILSAASGGSQTYGQVRTNDAS